MTYKDPDETKPVKSIVSSDTVLAPEPYTVGDRYLVIDADADAVDDESGGTVLKGSYQWKVHGAPTVPLSSALDVTGTIQALQATNQNFYGMSVHDIAASAPRTPFDNATGENWTDFVSFLEGSKDTDIKVFAVMTHPGGVGTGKVDGWGIVGGYESDGVTHKERPGTAAKKYAYAASELSNLSLTYPNLIGFTIDDFPAPNLVRESSQYTRAHVATIQGGAKKFNSNFEFWPTHYAGHALMTAIPSTRIGFTYGFPTTASEFVSAEHTFRIPTGIEIVDANLHFTYDDDYSAKADDGSANDGTGNYLGYDKPTITKGVRLNGTLIHAENTGYDKRIQLFSQDVAARLVRGTNTLKFTLSGTAGTNTFHDRVFSYGDIRLVVDYRPSDGGTIRRRTLTEGRVKSGRKSISSPTFSVNSGSMASHHLHYRYNNYLIESVSQSITGRPVAETNDRYRYLEDCDGAMVFYPNYTGTIMQDVGEVFASYRRSLPDKRIIHGQQGFLFGRDAPTERSVLPWQHVEKFRTASADTDGFVIWNLPCEQVSSSRGIFAERAAAGSGYDIRAGHIRKNAARYGHYQRFTTKVPYAGTLSYRMKADGGAANYFRHRLFHSAGYSNTVHGQDWFNQEVTGGWPTPTQIYTQSITASTKIGFEVYVHRGYGDSYASSQLSASINVGGLDIPLSRSAWDFESWYSGSSLQELQKSVIDYYGEVAGAAGYHNYIIQKRADGTWKTFPPEDGATVYVVSEGATRTYSDESKQWERLSAALSAVTVSGSLTVAAAVSREGFCSIGRDAEQTFNWTDALVSSSVTFDTTSVLDSTYYSASSDSVRILESGDYKISYGINWLNAAATAPTGALSVYVVTSSALSGTSTPWPPYKLRGSETYALLMGVSGSVTMGSNSNTFMYSLSPGDELKLYAERITTPAYFTDTPSTTTTAENSVRLLIEKVK